MKIKNNKDNLELTIEIPKFSKEYLQKLEEKKKEKLELTIKIPKIKVEKIDINELKNKLIKMNNKKKRKKIIITSITIITLSISSLFLYKITNNFFEKKKINELNKNITNKIETKEVIINNATNINPPQELDNPYWKYINYTMLDIDLNGLKEENNETIGWIQINNTNVNYPIVKTNNNEYYLKHQFDKSYNSAGWIFMDYRNNKIFNENKNSIIYGHGLYNKALFGSLNNTLKDSWYNNESNLVIKTIDDNYTYLWQIFSIYKIPTTDDYLQTTFSNDNHYLEFLTMLKDRSIKDFKVDLQSNDKIITLQTCFNSNEKTVIHGKLIKIAKLNQNI